jgi:hypothetical protein
MLKVGRSSNNHWGFKWLKLGVIHMANLMANLNSHHEISYITKLGRFQPTGELEDTYTLHSGSHNLDPEAKWSAFRSLPSNCVSDSIIHITHKHLMASCKLISTTKYEVH